MCEFPLNILQVGVNIYISGLLTDLNFNFFAAILISLVHPISQKLNLTFSIVHICNSEYLELHIMLADKFSIFVMLSLVCIAKFELFFILAC